MRLIKSFKNILHYNTVKDNISTKKLCINIFYFAIIQENVTDMQICVFVLDHIRKGKPMTAKIKDDSYDVIIVGAGPSGIFCAYELITKNSSLDILMLEKGNDIKNRICPKRKTGICVHCKPCNITTGFSGAGAFSDGKLTLASSETGGNLDQVIGEKKCGEMVKKADDIYLSFGADEHVYGIDKQDQIEAIRRKSEAAGLNLVVSPIRHLGTEASYEIYSKLQEYLLSHGVEIMFRTAVDDILVNDKAYGVICKDGREFYSDTIVVGAGREGASWFKRICEKHDIDKKPGTVDIGVRVECPDSVMQELNEALYESKLIYYTKTSNDKVRTFCQNPSGEVALENYHLPDSKEVTTVNGHAYKSKDMKTKFTNFALLVSKNFTEPFKEPLEYGTIFARAANMLAGGSVLVQSYGDIKKRRRSTPGRLEEVGARPSCSDAVPGDLTLVLPKRIMDDIIEMIEAMDKVAPGLADDNTLLYGIEVKFYSNKVIIDKNCETNIKGLYAIGDSSSWTRGLSMSSAMGLYTADVILNKKK